MMEKEPLGDGHGVVWLNHSSGYTNHLCHHHFLLHLTHFWVGMRSIHPPIPYEAEKPN